MLLTCYLITSLLAPPLLLFTDGKKCPKCKERIFHDRWKTSTKVLEERWAHQEAKKRELEEVSDFLGL